jgi:hypothetical protein
MIRGLIVCTLFSLLCGPSSSRAQGPAASQTAPRIATNDGRHALMVEGKPFLVLGAQINNSSSWPATLPNVWPTLEAMHVNTVEAPIYWEQMEPVQGQFDFSTVDLLLAGARAHHMHLVLLWFGTWKNGNMHYAPEWVKTNPQKYARVINADGEPIDVLSANSNANLEADKTAFAAMMHHLAQADGTEHTTILVQVENESGIVGAPRDFSAASNREFDGPVPADLLRILDKKPGTKKQSGTWRDIFGRSADETFQAYYQARYIEQIAAAGKREFNIPFYCNVWLSYPVAELPERQVPNPGIGYPSGGPVQAMLPLWKALVPSIDMIGPDIYSANPQFYDSVLKTYARPDNALWVPETGHDAAFAPFLFLALGQGAIGFSPFGADPTGELLEADEGLPASLPHAANFALLAPMATEIAALNFEGKLKTAVELLGGPTQELNFGPWQAEVRFGHASDGLPAPGTPNHEGRALVAQLGPDEFLVTGVEASVRFHLPGRLPGLRMQIISAEEGMYDNGVWKPVRLLNGDQTDRGLNFGSHPLSAVRIRIGKF